MAPGSDAFLSDFTDLEAQNSATTAINTGQEFSIVEILDNPDVSILPYSHEVQPMDECLGAPSQSMPTGTSSLVRDDEDILLARLREIFVRELDVGTAQSPDLPALRDAKDILVQFWHSISIHFPTAIKILLESPMDERSKVLLGEAGIVDFFLEILSVNDVYDEVVIPALQFVELVCRDTYSNKARILTQNSLLTILYKLWHPSLVPYAIPLLFHVCIENEPIIEQAAELKTAKILIDLLKRPQHGGASSVLDYLCSLLDLMFTTRTELYSDEIGDVLLQLATENEPNSNLYFPILTTALAWLHLRRVQLYSISANNGELLLRILIRSFSPSAYSSTIPTKATEIQQILLPRLRNGVIETLAAISKLPQFSSHYALDSKFVKSFVESLSSDNPQLQICACLVLRNFSLPDSSKQIMVHQFHIQEPLLSLIQTSNSGLVIKEAATFLNNLLLSTECQKEVGNKPFLKAAHRLLGMSKSPHLQLLGTTMTRLILSSSLFGVQQLLTPLSADPDSPANSKTSLSILSRLWKEHVGSQQSGIIALEVGLAIVNICCQLWSYSNIGYDFGLAELQDKLLAQNAEISAPLAGLLLQDTQPAARSKIVYVLACMARDMRCSGLIDNIASATEVSNSLKSCIVRATHDLSALKCDERNVLILISRMRNGSGQFRNQRLNLLFGGISKHFDLDLVMKEDLVENDGNEDGSLREI